MDLFFSLSFFLSLFTTPVSEASYQPGEEKSKKRRKIDKDSLLFFSFSLKIWRKITQIPSGLCISYRTIYKAYNTSLQGTKSGMSHIRRRGQYAIMKKSDMERNSVRGIRGTDDY